MSGSVGHSPSGRWKGRSWGTMMVGAYLWLLHLAAWNMLIARLLSFLAVDFDIGIFPILDVLSDGIILDQYRLFRKKIVQEERLNRDLGKLDARGKRLIVSHCPIYCHEDNQTAELLGQELAEGPLIVQYRQDQLTKNDNWQIFGL